MKKAALQGLWLPGVWVVLFCIEIVFFADGATAGIFEKVIIYLSFLFYSSKGFMVYVQKPWTSFLLSFALQFVFYWAWGFLIFYLKKRLASLDKPKRGTNV